MQDKQPTGMLAFTIVFEQQAGTVYGIRGSFLFAPLRAHPRFQALLRRMRLA